MNVETYDAQKAFDKHRKKEGFKTFKLTKAQAQLIEDSKLPFLIIPKEERIEAWNNVVVKPMPVFFDKPKDEDESTRRMRRMVEIDEQRKKEASLAKLKERFTKEKAERPPKQALGAHVRIVLKAGAKRAPGTKAAARFDEMAAFMKANPQATVADVIANTGYRVDDYKWDLNKGNLKADPVGGTAAAKIDGTITKQQDVAAAPVASRKETKAKHTAKKKAVKKGKRK